MEPNPSASPAIHELLAHASFLRALARQLCAPDRHGAEDLAQDVWLALLERRQESPQRGTSWLARVARNLRATRLRRPKVGLSSEELAAAAAKEDRGELERAELAEARHAVASAVQRLRDPYREVLILRYYEGLSLRETARRCGRPLQTVRTQIKRALPLLRAELARERGNDGCERALALVALGGRRPSPAIAPPVLAGASFVGAAGLVAALVWLGGEDSGARADSALGAVAAAPALQESEPLSSPRSPDESDRTAVLEPAPAAEAVEIAGPGQSAALEVLVLDGSGTPVPDADVLVLRREGWSVRGRSDDRGRAALELEAGDVGAGYESPGFAKFTARADGRARIQEVTIDAAQARTAPLELLIGGTGAHLSARAVDSDGFGIDGADVLVAPTNPPPGITKGGALRRFARHVAQADSDGRFELADLPLGPSLVYLRHPDLGISSSPVTVVREEQGVLDLAFAPGALVRGVVCDSAGIPRAGVVVRARWNNPLALPIEWVNAHTGSDGSYAMALPAGPSVELWATDAVDDHEQAYARFDLDRGEQIEWSPRLRRWDPVHVRLVDLTGAPLVDWLVALRSAQGDTLNAASSTKRDGTALLILPIEGELRLEIVGPFTAERGLPLHVVQGIQPHATYEYTFALDRERRGLGGLMGQLAPVGWSPPADSQVFVDRAEDGSSARVALDGDLRFQVGHLVPGRYDVVLRDGRDLVGVVTSVQVAAERTLDLGALPVAQPAELDLRLVEPGAPLEILVFTEEGPGRPLWRLPGGSASRLFLLPGRYALRRALEDGAQSSAASSFVLASGERLALGADLAPR